MEEIKFQGISEDKNEIQAYTRKTNNKRGSNDQERKQKMKEWENRDTWKKLCLSN